MIQALPIFYPSDARLSYLSSLFLAAPIRCSIVPFGQASSGNLSVSAIGICAFARLLLLIMVSLVDLISLVKKGRQHH